MADNKVFDRASLLTIYDNSAATESRIGQFTSVSQQEGLPPAEARSTHLIDAWTRAYWCEELKLCIIMQGVHISEFGMGKLPEHHPYRSDELPRLRMIRNAFNSADLLRAILRFADEWKDEMAEHLPDPTLRPLSGILERVADKINAGALGDNVTARVGRAVR